MIRFEAVIWNSATGKHETIERSAETEMELRARLSVELAGCEIKGVTALYVILNPAKEFLDAQEACELLGCDRSTLTRRVQAGEIRKHGEAAGLPRYRRSELENFLECSGASRARGRKAA